MGVNSINSISKLTSISVDNTGVSSLSSVSTKEQSLNITKGYSSSSINSGQAQTFLVQSGYLSSSIAKDSYFVFNIQKGYLSTLSSLIDYSIWRIVNIHGDPLYINGTATIITNLGQYQVDVVNGHFVVYHYLNEFNVEVSHEIIFIGSGYTGSIIITPATRRYDLIVQTECLPGGPYIISVTVTGSGQIQIVPEDVYDDLEYSLDGSEWQTNPVFENVSYGIHNIRVRRGCLESDIPTQYCWTIGYLEETRNEQFTLSYHIFEEKWVSFHDFIPNMYSTNTRLLHSFVNEIIPKMFTHNSSKKSYYYGVVHPSYIDVIKNSENNLHWDSVEWFTESSTSWGSPVKNKTFDTISFRNFIQSSTELELSEFKLLNVGGKWTLSNIRSRINDGKLTSDILQGFEDFIIEQKNAWELELFQSPYIIVRFKTYNKDELIIQLLNVKINESQ